MKPLYITLLAILLPQLAAARTWHILNDGSGDAPTVQAGIDSSAVGDTVLVGPGTYIENIDFLGKDVVVKSEFGPQSATLDGSAEAVSVVTFSGIASQAAVLEGFTITGGQFNGSGGGILCSAKASPRISGNRIIGNRAAWGGGMHAGDRFASEMPENFPAPVIENNLFQNNIAEGNGGGLRLASSNALVIGNIFRGNRTLVGDGGGLDVRLNVGTITIQDNEFWENVATDKGGGFHGFGSRFFGAGPFEVIGNLFVRNEALGAGTGDSGAGGGMCVVDIRGRISRNTLVGNRAFGESACGGGGIKLSGVIDARELSYNLIAFNEGCGIACRVAARVEVNLLWQNEGGDLGVFPSECPDEWKNIMIFEDPQFCNPESDDYSVAASSPALAGNEVIGAFAEPGCPPVEVRQTTWGGIKARYKN